MKCPGCGSELTSIEYQARAGDEAQRAITTCSKCPLNPSKLTLSIDPVIPHVHMPRFKRDQKERSILTSTNAKITYGIVAELKNLSNVDTEDMLDANCFNTIDVRNRLFRYYTSGPFINKHIHVQSRKKIGPNVNLLEIAEVQATPVIKSMHIDFKYKILSKETDTYLIKYSRDNIQIMSLYDNPGDDQIYMRLQQIYLNHMSPGSLLDYIPRVILDAISNLSARAHDVSTAADNENLFSTKVDGERIWLTRVGIVWVYSRRLLRHSIIGWEIDQTISPNNGHTYGPVIDIELMIGHDPILLDVLMDSDGELSPGTRNISWIYNQFDSLVESFPYLKKVFKRRFRRRKQLAELDSQNASYPTDGTVALPLNGIDMMKLKPIKSVELMLYDDGILMSAEEVPIFRIEKYNHYTIGKIYEVRFIIESGKCNIHSIEPRPDKTKANDMTAIDSILESSITRLPKDAVRIELWRWSAQVREEVYRQGLKSNPGRRIVLDIGTGDGQSSDSYIKSSDCSFILIERDEQKCKKLRERLRVRTIETNPRVLNRVLSQLKTGRMKYCILNCKVEDILEDSTVFNMVFPELKCIIACFSVQFITNSLSRLISKGIPLIGACYVYDGVDTGGSIINTSGISMTRVDDERAVVTWGKDNPYFEPAIETIDFPSNFMIMDSSRFVEFPSRKGMEDIKTISSALKIIISK